MFKEEMSYFLKNQEELVNKHDGKVLAIKESELLGVYDNVLDALEEMLEKYELGTFMLQPCVQGPEAYTVTVSTLGIINPSL